jgi:fatty acid desaturase
LPDFSGESLPSAYYRWRFMDRPHLQPDVLREMHRARGDHWLRLAVFILLYAGSSFILYCVAISHPHAVWIWLACVPIYLLAAGSLHGISLFTHEAVHGTLSANPFLNRALGAVCAWPMLQNFAAYKVLHLRHHNHLGDEGDPDHYQNYTSWSWLLFSMYWGRLLLGYPAYITAIPILGYRQGKGSERFWILLEVGCVVALVVAAILSPIPRLLLIHAWLIPMVIINTLVNIRGMSQHTLLEHHSDPILGTRSILTNRVTAFFMCNENYHLEHHLYPGVPWYNLPKLHRALREDLVSRGAPYIDSYFAFVREFVLGSFRRSPLGRAGHR